MYQRLTFVALFATVLAASCSSFDKQQLAAAIGKVESGSDAAQSRVWLVVKGGRQRGAASRCAALSAALQPLGVHVALLQCDGSSLHDEAVAKDKLAALCSRSGRWDSLLLLRSHAFAAFHASPAAERLFLTSTVQPQFAGAYRRLPGNGAWQRVSGSRWAGTLARLHPPFGRRGWRATVAGVSAGRAAQLRTKSSDLCPPAAGWPAATLASSAGVLGCWAGSGDTTADKKRVTQLLRGGAAAVAAAEELLDARAWPAQERVTRVTLPAKLASSVRAAVVLSFPSLRVTASSEALRASAVFINGSSVRARGKLESAPQLMRWLRAAVLPAAAATGSAAQLPQPRVPALPAATEALHEDFALNGLLLLLSAALLLRARCSCGELLLLPLFILTLCFCLLLAWQLYGMLFPSSPLLLRCTLAVTAILMALPRLPRRLLSDSRASAAAAAAVDGDEQQLEQPDRGRAVLDGPLDVRQLEALRIGMREERAARQRRMLRRRLRRLGERRWRPVVDDVVAEDENDGDGDDDDDEEKAEEEAGGEQLPWAQSVGETECSVCLLPFEKGVIVRQLPCLHCFHPSCIDSWLLEYTARSDGRCPLCREAVLLEDVPFVDGDGGALAPLA